jgi:hypothetical protein
MTNETDLSTVLNDFGWQSFKSTDTDRYYRHLDHPGHVIWRRHRTADWGHQAAGRHVPAAHLPGSGTPATSDVLTGAPRPELLRWHLAAFHGQP